MTFKELYPDITNLTEELEEYQKKQILLIEKEKRNINYKSIPSQNEYDFYKKIINDYCEEIISMILKEYKLNTNEMQKIISLKDRVHVITKESDKYKQTIGYCDNQEEIYLIPSNVESDDIIEKLITIKGILLHEIHHMLTTCKNSNEKIRIIDGENAIIASLGNYLDEGIVELSTLLLAEKYHLFYIPSNYLKNVLFVKNIMKALNISEITELWNKNYKEILSQYPFSKEVVEEYEKLDIEYIKKKKNKGIRIKNTDEYNEAKVTR